MDLDRSSGGTESDRMSGEGGFLERVIPHAPGDVVDSIRAIDDPADRAHAAIEVGRTLGIKPAESVGDTADGIGRSTFEE